MSDTSNRGRILFILMTNRPDKLDVDIKRAGRLDRKVPLLYAQSAEEIEAVLLAQLRKHRLTLGGELSCRPGGDISAAVGTIQCRLRGHHVVGG